MIKKAFVAVLLAVVMVSALGCHWHRRHFSGHDGYDRYDRYDRR
jgi:hypothetical protein